MTREDAIRKIQSALELSSSSNPSEAATALSMARKLMLKFKVEEAEVETKNDSELGTTRVAFLSRVQTWETSLITAIAHHFNCTVTLSPSVRLFTLYGSDLDRTIAEHAFISTRNRLLVLLEEAKKNRRAWENPKAFRTSWLLGAAMSITEKITKAAQTDDQVSPETFAIVSASRRVAESFMRESVPHLLNHSPDLSFSSNTGFTDGARVGRSIDFVQGLK